MSAKLPLNMPRRRTISPMGYLKIPPEFKELTGIFPDCQVTVRVEGSKLIVEAVPTKEESEREVSRE